MAPDLNAVSSAARGEKWDYTNPGAQGYNIPDVTLNVSNGCHDESSAQEFHGLLSKAL